MFTPKRVVATAGIALASLAALTAGAAARRVVEKAAAGPAGPVGADRNPVGGAGAGSGGQ